MHKVMILEYFILHKKSFKALFLCCLLVANVTFLSAQTGSGITPIYVIQGSSSSSTLVGTKVKTEGVVTLTLFDKNQIGGFFIQDTLGDGNNATSDGVFVESKESVKKGDYIILEATVEEKSSRTQLSNVIPSSLQKIRENVKIPYLHILFPNEFPTSSESIEGMSIAMDQTFYLTNTNSLARYGELILSSTLLRSPTDAAYPKTEEYEELLAWNAKDQIMLDDGSVISSPNPTPFLGKDGTCRTGSKTDTIRGVFAQITSSLYALYPERIPVFYGNPRTLSPNENALGDYNLKVCGFNVENYLNKSDLQRTRIVKALAAIDADLFGICEVIQNKAAMDRLLSDLNKYVGSDEYAYIPWISSTSTYTTTQIIYKKEKLEPYKNYYMLNASPGVSNRRLFQGFVHKETKTPFIFGVNHLKAKSGTGTGANADQGDGQGIYNYQRIKEAKDVVAKLKELVYFYNTTNILCVGDYNAFAKEDPIKVFNDAGYYNQTERFSDTSYSYHFGNHVEYLDYSLANDSMARYVTGSIVWHINADEPSFLDYESSSGSEDFLYRSSDHDPIVVGLKFPASTGIEDAQKESRQKVEIMPQPCKDDFEWFTNGNEIENIEIYNLAGKKLVTVNVSKTDNGKVYISELAAGCYVAKFISKASVYTRKIVKQ